MGHVTEQIEAVVREALMDESTMPYSVALSTDHRRKINILLTYGESHHGRRDIALVMRLLMFEFGRESSECQAAVMAFLTEAESRR
jgi:hypothetical protein